VAALVRDAIKISTDFLPQVHENVTVADQLPPAFLPQPLLDAAAAPVENILEEGDFQMDVAVRNAIKISTDILQLPLLDAAAAQVVEPFVEYFGLLSAAVAVTIKR
jgi:hypothetical protein